jgi:hypothetical protein
MPFRILTHPIQAVKGVIRFHAMSLTSPLWTKNGYGLYELKRPWLIRKVGIQLQNCLAEDPRYGLSVRFGKANIYSFAQNSTALVAMELLRLNDQLFFNQITAKHNHLINGTEPFYEPLCASIAYLEEEVFREHILRPPWFGPRLARIPYTTEHPFFIARLVEASRQLGLPLYEALNEDTSTMRKNVSALMADIIQGERFKHLTDQERVLALTTLCPFAVSLTRQQVSHQER